MDLLIKKFRFSNYSNRSKLEGVNPLSLREKLFIICGFECSFQYYNETVKQWVKEQGEGIVIDYELIKINDHKSHSFYTVSSLEEFLIMLNTAWAREWDKANNYKAVIYKMQLVG